MSMQSFLFNKAGILFLAAWLFCSIGLAEAGYIRIGDESALEIGTNGVLFLQKQDVYGNGHFINNGKLMTRVPLKVNGRTGLQAFLEYSSIRRTSEMPTA